MAKPLWRQLFDAVDRRVAGPVEAGTGSDAFGDLVAISWRLTRRVQREVERRSRRVLHLLNLPAATDVRRLSEQVAALQRELREIEDHEFKEPRT
jgi:polyhydroxyalkanoate synthesis regulator phasin